MHRTFFTDHVSPLLRALFLFALIFLCASQAEARVYLDITSPNFRKVKVAVPYFTEKPQPDKAVDSGKRMADFMSRALAFHGFVEIIDPTTYNGSQDWDWPSLGTEFTVLGQFEHDPSGIAIEMRLVDIHGGRMILGRRYKGATSKTKDILKKFCDEVVQQLTGEPGISLSQIAFVSNGTGAKEIYLADVLGEEIRQVTQHEYLAVSPRISPDGKLLAYTSYHRGNANLYITELSTLRKTTPISRRKGLNMAPSWAPDSKVMAATLSKDNNPDLYIIDNSGNELRRLTSGEGINVSPSWAPDGKSMAFVSDRSGTPQVYVMDIKTKAVKRITFLGNENTTPNWSPKGDWIAYTGLINGARHVMMIKPEGGTPVQVTQSWGEHESPCWSPDGRQIVFSRKRNNKQEICAIFKSGAGLRTLFSLKGDQSSPQWGPRQEM